MARATMIINAVLWVALGCLCIYPALTNRGESGLIIIAVFGTSFVLNGVACILTWRVWRVSSPVVGAVMVLYAFDVLLLGHGEDVGGTMQWLMLIGASLGLGVWSILLPFCTARSGPPSQFAPPNGGPAERVGNSGVAEGPPSVG